MTLLGARSPLLELMDLGPLHYSQAEYELCLNRLGRLGRWLGGDRATFRVIDSLQPRPLSFLDVGCGGGQFASRLARRYPLSRVVGIDIDASAVEFALRHQAEKANPLLNLSYRKDSLDTLDLPDGSVDVVLATLMCHHLSDEEIVKFLKKACALARRFVIINDLHRHLLAWLSFAAVAPWLFPSRLIFHDGLLSIRKGFVAADWRRYLAAAGLAAGRGVMERHWAFRWMVRIAV